MLVVISFTPVIVLIIIATVAESLDYWVLPFKDINRIFSSSCGYTA